VSSTDEQARVAILPISLQDITPELARASGFKGVVDLLKVRCASVAAAGSVG
jgi:hypothetical protein